MAAKLNSQVEVTTQLPLMVNEQELAKYPDFRNLLKTLTKHIAEDGISNDIKQELSDARDALNNEKLRYLQTKVIYDELKDVLFNHEINNNQLTTNNQTSQLYKTANDALVLAEVKTYLDFNPETSDSDVTLLGLTPEMFNKIDAHKMVLQQGLIPELENELKRKCEQIAEYHECSKNQETDSKFLFAKATQLPAMIEAEKRQLKDQKRQIREDHRRQTTQFIQYYQCLVNRCSLFEELINKYQLEWQRKYDEITCNWLAAKCSAMCLKIRVLHDQLLCDTYTPDTVAALRKIRTSVQLKENETKEDFQRALESLQAYKSVGMGFDVLVRHYGELVDEIENKKWALTELRHSEVDQDDLWK